MNGAENMMPEQPEWKENEILSGTELNAREETHTEPLTGDRSDPSGEESNPDSNGRKKKEENLTLGQEIYQTLQSLVCIVIVIILVFTVVARITIVDGSSMENTLLNGDIVLTRVIGYQPKQGDIVVLTKTSFREQSIIKRVIATEGQTVDIDYTTSTVYVDGVAIEEPYIKELMIMPNSSDQLNHITIPEGCIFVMGDNRNRSTDSRDSRVGIIDTECVIGKAVLVMFPFSRIKML